MSYNMGDAVGYIKLNIKDFQDKAKQVENQSKQLEKSVDGLSGIFDVAGKVAAAAFATISAAAGTALKTVLDVGTSFESSMSQVAATMGMSADEIANNTAEYEKLTNAAKEMGATTKFSATQAANALNYLALAGYDADESIEMLPKTLRLAAAGGMDLANASDMVTDAMSALGLHINDADSFIDQLAKTAQSSNTSVEQLGNAILQIGGTAKILAGGTTELNTALGILANNGIKAAEGGTALRQILLNLTAPTEKAAKYMDQIGFSAYDMEGNIKPLNQTFAELSEILDSMTQQGRQEALSNIFDARQLKSANALLANYGESWEELYQKIDQSQGAAEMMADTMQENLAGAATIAKSALEAVAETAYEGLQKNFTNAVKSATKEFESLNKTLQSKEMQKNLQVISKELSDVLVKFTAFVANTAIPKFVEWMGNIKDTASALKSVFAGFAVTLTGVAVGFVACNTAVQAAIVQFAGLKVAALAANAALLANPVTAVAVAVGVLTTALIRANEVYKDRLETFVEANKQYQKEYDAVMELNDAYEESKNKFEEMSKANADQVENVNALVSRLDEYARKENLTAAETENVKDIISQLNEILPIHLDYVDGEIVGYDKLKDSVAAYNKQLEAEALLTAQRELVQSAAVTKNKAKEYWDETTEAAEQATEQYEKARTAWLHYQDNHNWITEEDEKKAKAQGMSIKNYLEAQYETAKETYENAVIANTKAKEIYKESEKDLKDSEDKMLKLRYDAGEEIEGMYRSQGQAQESIAEQNARNALKIQDELNEEQIKKENELAEKRAQEAEKLLADLEDLDNKYKLREIATEEELVAEKEKLFDVDWDKTNKKLLTEYDKINTFREQQAEKEKQQMEKEIKERQQQIEKKADEEAAARKKATDRQIDEIKTRNKLEESYTDEMMYNDLEKIRDGLDKESDEWYNLNKEIVLGRKEAAKKLDDENKRIAQKEFTTWQRSFNSVVSEAENAYKQLEQNQKSFASGLIGSAKLYETETKKIWDASKMQFVDESQMKITTKNIKQQTKEIENYSKNIEKIKSKGGSESLISKIFAMDAKEGEKFAEQLSKMSSSSIKQYSDAYDKLVEESQQMSETYYQTELETFKKNYSDKVQKILDDVPKNTKLVGEETLQGFVDGLQEKSDDSAGVLSDIMKDTVAKTKEILGIHSPSKVYEEIGENTMQGFINGADKIKDDFANIFEELGTDSAKKFVDNFKNTWNSFESWINDKISSISAFTAQVSQSFASQTYTTPYNANTSGIQPVLMQGNINTLPAVNITKNDIVEAIQTAMPSGDVILQINGNKFAQISRQTLNAYAANSGNLNLQI